MPFINLPPVISEVFWELENRVRRLETAYRFNAPSIDFSTNLPTNAREGDMYYATDIGQLVYYNGTDWHKLNQSNYTP
jgi:hypothetical protein